MNGWTFLEETSKLKTYKREVDELVQYKVVHKTTGAEKVSEPQEKGEWQGAQTIWKLLLDLMGEVEDVDLS